MDKNRLRLILDLGSKNQLESNLLIHNSEDSLLRVFQSTAESVFYNSHLRNMTANFQMDAEIKVIDLGCGDGKLSQLIVNQFPRVELTSVDPNADSIKQARLRLRGTQVNLLQNSYQDLVYQNEFDFCSCSEVYEHVIDREELSKCIYSLLKPGGILTLSTPTILMDKQPRVKNAKFFILNKKQYDLKNSKNRDWQNALQYHPGSSSREIISFLTSAGFEIESRQFCLPYIDNFSRSILWLLLRMFGSKNSDKSVVFIASRQRNQIRAAEKMQSALLLIQGLIGYFPRIFGFLGSRVVIVARKPF